MQEIRYELERRLSEPVDLEQTTDAMRPHLPGYREPARAAEPHPSGLNRKQRRALARERR